jgi:cob(I)alamin adenosyltransferase
MKIYTRTGDQGDTYLSGGQRVRKNCARIEACGTIDETNSAVGAARSFLHDSELDAILTSVQKDLFILGGDLATHLPVADGETTYHVSHITADHVEALERLIDWAEAELPALHTFILPTGGQDAAMLHLARTICRRAERRIVSLNEHEQINMHALIYLNRLSDLLFVLARLANQRARIAETPWHAL